MRLDIDELGFDWGLGNRATVYLDGVEQPCCTVADEEEGYIIRYKRLDPEKKPLNDLTEKIYGEVKIVVMDSEWV